MSKILVVEDDNDASAEVKALLTANRMTVEVVRTVSRARDFLSVGEYDLIILDWNLPDGKGVDLLNEIRASGCHSRVLILTGRGGLNDKLDGFAAGADDYLVKPYFAAELLCRVHAILSRHSVRMDSVIVVGNLVLDTNANRVTKGGEEIRLLPKEFALLEFFLRNPNRVFSAEALLERVWPTENESTSHTVVSTIHRLRRKIDSPESESVIRNQFGQGYVFLEDKVT